LGFIYQIPAALGRLHMEAVMNSVAKLYRSAMAEARRRNPGVSDADIEDEGLVDEILDQWASDAEEDRLLIVDTPCIERGHDNCDTWGTGEGQFHGRC
jgi:hypothetical protein